MESITLNGTTLWSRYGSKMLFARQLEPTKGLYRDEQHAALTTPVLVGYDGEMGRELSSVLEQNEQLKKSIEQLTEEREQRYAAGLEGLVCRLARLEKPWWKRR